MKKILIALVVLVFAAPAMATVTITATQTPDTNEVVISFTSDETNRIRAFGLDVQLNNDANIVAVIPAMAGVCTETDKGYGIFPGTIQIDALGNITDVGSIAAEYGDLPGDTLPGPPDGNGVTLEAASLYAPVGSDVNAPLQSGVLCTLILDADTCLTISANVSRAGPTGVVMENPDEVVTVVYPSECIEYVHPGPGIECMKDTAPEYADWGAWGKPDCWCYAKQCRGDINGQSFFGKPVVLSDLNIFKLAFNKTDLELAQVTDGICADLNHASFFGKRVVLSDLNIFKLYFNLLEAQVPECDKTNFNDWCVPGQPCPPTP